MPGGAATLSRKEIDGWAESAPTHGAARRARPAPQGRASAFQVEERPSAEAELRGAAEALGLEEGGLALIVAAPETVAAGALGALRLELAQS